MNLTFLFVALLNQILNQMFGLILAFWGDQGPLNGPRGPRDRLKIENEIVDWLKKDNP